MERTTMDKGRMIMITVVVVALAFTLLLYAGAVARNNGSVIETGLIGLIAFFIVAIFVLFFTRQAKSIKEGMPLEDERSKRVQEKAGHYTFLVGIWILLGIGMFEEHVAELFGQETLEAGSATGFAILLMAITFFVFWGLFSMKGTE